MSSSTPPPSMPDSIRINECRSCGETDLRPFLDLGLMPLADRLLRPDELQEEEPRYPLEVALCPHCTLVQILDTVPPEALYQREYPYYSSFSDALLAHSRENVDSLIAARGLDASSLVVELASNDGYLLQYYRRQGIPVLGIDPAAGPVAVAREKGIETLNEFFGLALAQELAGQGRRADVIHGNNVLAHVADLNGFVAGIRVLLKDEGVAVIEVPYLVELIEQVEFDTIYHEHHCYFSLTALANLFRRHGLSLNEVKPLSIHGGSLRLYVNRFERVQGSVVAMLDREQSLGVAHLDYYRDFGQRVAALREALVAMIDQLQRDGHRIAAYGAAAKGAILLNYFGIGSERIDFVADRNVHKQGRYLPGVRIAVVDPARILSEMPGCLLILPWNFREEIMAQQEAYRRAGGRFLVPIPEPELH